MCQATNIGGTFRDISSLIVQDEPTPSKKIFIFHSFKKNKIKIQFCTNAAVLYPERKFFVFHEYGIAVYEPSACRLHHQIHSTDLIPGTQEYVCGDKGVPCSWGRSINVGNSYIYVTQPLRDRILVISTVQIVVVRNNCLNFKIRLLKDSNCRFTLGGCNYYRQISCGFVLCTAFRSCLGY